MALKAFPPKAAVYIGPLARRLIEVMAEKEVRSVASQALLIAMEAAARRKIDVVAIEQELGIERKRGAWAKAVP
jgi:hypothetical protein